MGRLETLQASPLEGKQLVIDSGLLVYSHGKPEDEDYFNPAVYISPEGPLLFPRREKRVDGWFKNEIGCLLTRFDGEKLQMVSPYQPFLSPLLSQTEMRENYPCGFEDPRFHYLGRENVAIITYTDYNSQRQESCPTRVRLSVLSWSKEGGWQERRTFFASPSDRDDKNGVLIPPRPEHKKKGVFFHRSMDGLRRGPWAIEVISFRTLDEIEQLGVLPYEEWKKRDNRLIISPNLELGESHVGMGPPPLFLRTKENGEEDWALIYHVASQEQDTLVYRIRAVLATFSSDREEVRVGGSIALFEPDEDGFWTRGGEKKRIVFTTGMALKDASGFYNPSFEKPNKKAEEIWFFNGKADKTIGWYRVDFKRFRQALLGPGP